METEKAADGNAEKKSAAAVSGDALRAALGGLGAAGAVPGGARARRGPRGDGAHACGHATARSRAE